MCHTREHVVNRRQPSRLPSLLELRRLVRRQYWISSSDRSRSFLTSPLMFCFALRRVFFTSEGPCTCSCCPNFCACTTVQTSFFLLRKVSEDILSLGEILATVCLAMAPLPLEGRGPDEVAVLMGPQTEMSVVLRVPISLTSSWRTLIWAAAPKRRPLLNIKGVFVVDHQEKSEQALCAAELPPLDAHVSSPSQMWSSSLLCWQGVLPLSMRPS